MRSLRLKIALWFTVSMLTVLAVFAAITYAHLRHELRVERWERAHPQHPDWTLHGSYSESEVEDIAGELWRLSLLYALPVGLLAFGIGYLLARRSFQPVAELKQQLSAIGARSLGRRIVLPAADREFEPIVAQINLLLERLEDSFGQLTEYSAQVAHELRTPLTLLRLKLEDAAAPIDPDFSETIQDELARLSDYVDQCLLLATAEQGRLEVKSQEVPLHKFVAEMIETYQLWAGQGGRAVTCVISDEVTVSSDPRYLRHILHNLLTNAVRHGSGPIRVTIARTAEWAACRIENEIAMVKTDDRRMGLGLRLARALASHLGCQIAAQASGKLFVAEVAWYRTESPKLHP